MKVKVKVILCILFILCVDAALAVNFPAKGRCTGDYVRIRTAPNTDARILGRAFNGAELTILDEMWSEGRYWYKLSNPFGSGTAWIAGQYVKIYESHQETQNNYEPYDSDSDYDDYQYSDSVSSGNSDTTENWQTRVETKDRCFRCHGSGKVDCSRCNGSGRTYEYVSTPNYSGKMTHTMSRVEHSCSKCYGSGKVECGDCGGRGYTIRYQ